MLFDAKGNPIGGEAEPLKPFKGFEKEYLCVMCHKEKPLTDSQGRRLLFARYDGYDLGITCPDCRTEHAFYHNKTVTYSHSRGGRAVEAG